MDPHTGDRLNDRGFASTQFLVAAALALVAVVWLTDALVVRYAEGVMGMAAREGARAGSVSGPTACRTEAATWLADGLGGSLGDVVSITCEVTATSVSAVVEADFDAWLPGIPDWEVERTATAVLEP